MSDCQLNFTIHGKSFAPELSGYQRSVKYDFDDKWWTRFSFVMSTIKLHPDGTPVSVVKLWLEDWDIWLNQTQLRHALAGLGHPLVQRLKGPHSGVGLWIVKPIPQEARQRRPSTGPVCR